MPSTSALMRCLLLVTVNFLCEKVIIDTVFYVSSYSISFNETTGLYQRSTSLMDIIHSECRRLSFLLLLYQIQGLIREPIFMHVKSWPISTEVVGSKDRPVGQVDR